MTPDSIHVLLIEDDLTQCDIFKTIIRVRSDIELIGITDSSTKGVELTKKFLPDAIILDLELNEGDGIDFLYQIKKISLSKYPFIVVTTNTISKSVLQNLRENGADFIFTKNIKGYSPKQVVNLLLRMQKYYGCNFDTPINSCGTAANQLDTEEVYEDGFQQIISEQLVKIGIPTNFVGYQYIIEVVILLIKAGDFHKEITKDIYPAIAKKYNTTAAGVERAIRNAIEKAWNTTDISILEKYYSQSVNPEKGRPTNKEFIYYLTIRIKNIIK